MQLTTGKNDIRETAVRNYIDAYNCFDVPRMLSNMDAQVLFQNISDGKITLELKGIAAFRQQAEAVLPFFTERKQTISNLEHVDADSIEVDIIYEAVLSNKFPDAALAGTKLSLKGKSVFRFSASDSIVSVTDIA